MKNSGKEGNEYFELDLKWDKNIFISNFMVSPCINNITHFIVQLMHTKYKILRLLK